VTGERRIHFEPFALDLVNECLWKGSQAIKLRPKAFAVLEHLVGRAGQLVTKETLIEAVWRDTFVGEAVLKVAIRELREALADDSKSPRFIETAHRRGYRFIGRIDAGAKPAGAQQGGGSPAVSRHTEVPGGIVGRGHALSRMRAWFDKVREGERQVVFVTGEAGIGKTTVLDAFLSGIASDGSARICSGQCLEQYGMSEAYFPILEAMRQLCREDAEVVDVLRGHAPMWLLQMPSLVTPLERESLAREALGATRERMLREIADALYALAARAPLVLALEDLHWSDYSTLDLISYVARHRRAGRLMVIGTYRPAELIASGHPLKTVKQELLAKQQCGELSLEYLSQEAVALHLAARFPGHSFPIELSALIHERTEGNPLFMVNTIDYLLTERLIERHEGQWRMSAAIDAVKVGVPDSIRHLIETHIDRLDERDQRILEAASVAGAEFSVASVSAALDDETDTVVVRCEELSRRHQFIRDCAGEAVPTGDTVGRYGFVHAVYRHVLYERVSISRRVLLHRRIGEQREALYRDRTSEIAAELAMHFERAANYQHASRYFQQAAHNAMQRSAYGEAIALSRRGLDLLATAPNTRERALQELWLYITLGVPLIATEGYAAPSVGAVYKAARALCERLGDTPEISQVLWGLWTFHVLKAELSTALEIAGEFLRLAERLRYPGLAVRGHWAMEITCTHQGQFTLAVEHFDKALSLYEPDQHRGDALLYALDPGVAMRCFVAWSLWFLGAIDRALARMQEAVALARDLREPHGLAHALVFAAILHQLRRERPAAQQYAEAAIAVSDEHSLVLYLAMATVVRGWSLGGRPGGEKALGDARRGLAAWESTGAQLMRPHFLALLASVQEPSNDAEGLRILSDALASAESTGECCYQAELYRLKGEYLLGQSAARVDVEVAENCFRQSLVIARGQDARSLELRSAISLARLYQLRGLHDAARDLVRPIYDRFTEGFDTPDLLDARALLQAHRAP
jgi:DNA-binding winged helix-turn-helix (wHTH) protein/tetratricopeptide (TPR) repeat protein